MGIGNFIPREVWLIEDAEVPDGIRDYVRGGGKTYMTEEPVNGKARISPDVEGSMGIFVPEGQFRQEVRVKEGHNAFLNGVMERHVADGGKLYTMGVPENGEIFITVEPTFSDNAAPICSVRLSDIEYVNVEMAEQDFAAAVAAIPVNDNQMEQ